MSLAPKRGILTLIWVFLLVFGVVQESISAQEGSQVRLAPVNTQEFPKISSYLDIRTPEGNFLHGLEQNNVRIIENGTRLAVQEFQHIRTGVQFVVAISPGASFEIRDVQGTSRYEYLAGALQEWAQARQGSTVDDLSLVVSNGPEITHINDLDRWTSYLESFTPSGDENGPDFDVLTRALDVAADPVSSPGMSGAVLLVTPLPGPGEGLGLQSMTARASQQGIKIFIWLVASSELFASPEAEEMKILAEQTGGTLFAYSGQEAIPSPEEFLDALRDTYFVAYDSQIKTSGTHQVSAEINYQGELITSQSQEFEIEVLPPSIAFISPPTEIERILPEPQGESKPASPSAQTLDLLIEFPDEQPREIEKTSLYVDGDLVAVNRQEPFDQFTWDISGYSSNGERILTADIVDSLGLTAQSVETSVMINVSDPDPDFVNMISRNWLTLVAVLAAGLGGISLLFLVLSGRLRPGFLLNRRRKKKRSEVLIRPEHASDSGASQSRASWIKRINWRRGPITVKPRAQLIPLTDTDPEDSQPPIQIIKNQVIIGKNEQLVDQVLPDASVEDIHATLMRELDGTYRLSDESSIAGTWVNYQEIPEAGQVLEHGDLIHFGRMGFRFILRNPESVRKPVLRYEEAK